MNRHLKNDSAESVKFMSAVSIFHKSIIFLMESNMFPIYYTHSFRNDVYTTSRSFINVSRTEFKLRLSHLCFLKLYIIIIFVVSFRQGYTRINLPGVTENNVAQLSLIIYPNQHRFMLIGGENMFPHRLRRVNRSVIWFIVITNISVDWIVMPLDQSVRSNILCSFYSLGYKVSNKICLHFF